jgi:hypothetical protein
MKIKTLWIKIIKTLWIKIKCFFGFHKWIKDELGMTGEIYIRCRHCYKEDD